MRKRRGRENLRGRQLEPDGLRNPEDFASSGCRSSAGFLTEESPFISNRFLNHGPKSESSAQIFLHFYRSIWGSPMNKETGSPGESSHGISLPGRPLRQRGARAGPPFSAGSRFAGLWRGGRKRTGEEPAPQAKGPGFPSFKPSVHLAFPGQAVLEPPAKGPALRLVPIAETAGKSQTGYRHSRTPVPGYLSFRTERTARLPARRRAAEKPPPDSAKNPVDAPLKRPFPRRLFREEKIPDILLRPCRKAPLSSAPLFPEEGNSRQPLSLLRLSCISPLPS
jgi:hypothetical protein